MSVLDLPDQLAQHAHSSANMHADAIVKLIEALSEHQMPANKIASMVNGIAEWEGKAFVFDQATRMVVYLTGHPESSTETMKESVLSWLLEQATMTDDTWSGRCNDARRSKQDGVLEAVTTVQRMMKGVY